MKRIKLCADDYALSRGISAAILQLVDSGRLSAVSCMVNLPLFAEQAAQLIARKGQAQFGLHFNLTEGGLLSRPGTECFSLNGLLLKSHLRLCEQSLITAELHAQLDRYIEVMGALPDFIDGHQHVHQFPQVRASLLAIYQSRLTNKPWLRTTYPALKINPYQFKTAILGLTGGKSWQQQLTRLAIPHNSFFAGIYDFDSKVNYRALFRQWLALAPDDTLIMCHPGREYLSGDVIAEARINEFNYLASSAFLDDCMEFAVNIE
ncbi:MAG: ChbG/HpnK family deacetylase [Legionella sp.]